MNSRIFQLALMVCLLFPQKFLLANECPSQKTISNIPNIKDLTYHQARKKLLASGWTPVANQEINAKTVARSIGGNAPIFWQKGYHEVEFCAGTGLGQCIFAWKDKNHNQLNVLTAGEEDPKQKAFALVTGARLHCK